MCAYFVNMLIKIQQYAHFFKNHCITLSFKYRLLLHLVFFLLVIFAQKYCPAQTGQHKKFISFYCLLDGQHTIAFFLLLYLNHSCHTADQYDNSEDYPVPSEYLEIMLFDVVHQEADDYDGYKERCNHSDSKHQ